MLSFTSICTVPADEAMLYPNIEKAVHQGQHVLGREPFPEEEQYLQRQCLTSGRGSPLLGVSEPLAQ